MNQPRPVSNLVVVGSSAGGIDALSVLVASLPEDFPAPVVIAQHLDPNRPSRLDQILGRRSTLPVRQVTNREPLEAGTIYVVPANRHVAISDHAIELSDDAERPKPSIDLLLSSAATSFGEALIAVILTGSGTDGANGARIVHEAGGTVIIQNPVEAEFSSMPRSLAPSTVDLVTDLARIGPVLTGLLQGVEAASLPDERRSLDEFLTGLRERFGLDFSSYKTPTIRRRLQRRMVATDSGNLESYVRYLDRHPEEYHRLLDALLIKVTEFFRDPELFAVLREKVLPRIIERARAGKREIRIWSAGCATGEEAYTLAILLLEEAARHEIRPPIQVFASDLDSRALGAAREGRFPAAIESDVSKERLNRFFVHQGDFYRVRQDVRDIVLFSMHDVLKDPPFSHIDLISCRNVLIYLDRDLQ